MVGIIDYAMGNLRSVQKACERVGGAARVLADPGELAEGIDRLVLPGVGAFGDGMAELRARGWVAPIRAWADQGRPLLGICLGMQLLFERSEESAEEAGGEVAGLGILPGRVAGFERGHRLAGRRRKVPHMGWNTITWDRPDPLLAGLAGGVSVYFVHGYYAEPDEREGPVTSARCEYGERFCASAWRERVWGVQFHPEKSQAVGLAMIRNFCQS